MLVHRKTLFFFTWHETQKMKKYYKWLTHQQIIFIFLYVIKMDETFEPIAYVKYA